MEGRPTRRCCASLPPQPVTGWLRRHCERLCRLTRAGRLGRLGSWGHHEAAAEEIEACAAKHLALEHLQPVDMPLHRAGTPAEGDPRFHGRVVFIEPGSKASQRLQRTRGRALEPGIEAL